MIMAEHKGSAKALSGATAQQWVFGSTTMLHTTKPAMPEAAARHLDDTTRAERLATWPLASSGDGISLLLLKLETLECIRHKAFRTLPPKAVAQLVENHFCHLGRRQCKGSRVGQKIWPAHVTAERPVAAETGPALVLKEPRSAGQIPRECWGSNTKGEFHF